jgi:hypothetical protein
MGTAGVRIGVFEHRRRIETSATSVIAAFRTSTKLHA